MQVRIWMQMKDDLLRVKNYRDIGSTIRVAPLGFIIVSLKGLSPVLENMSLILALKAV